MTTTLSKHDLSRWIDAAIDNFRSQDLLGVSDAWQEIYGALSEYLSDNLEVDERLLWMIDAADDALPDIIYLLQRLKNNLVAALLKAGMTDELPPLLSWFDRAIVVMSEKHSGKASRERLLSKPFETIFWKSRDGMYISTMDGRFVHGNEALVKMLGHGSLKEMLEMDITDELYVNPDQRNKMLKHLSTDGFYDHHEFDFRTTDGRARTALESCYLVENPDGEALIVGMMVDVTEERETRRRTDEHLREIEKVGVETRLQLRKRTRALEDVLNLNDHPVLVVDPSDFRILHTNQTFRKRFKITARKKSDAPVFRDLFSADEWMKVFSLVTNIVQRKHFHIKGVLLLDPDGDSFPADLAVLVHEAQENVQLYIQVEERTSMHWMETQLQRFRDNVEGLFESLPIGVIGIRNDGSVSVVNRQATQMLGYGARQLKNISFLNQLFARDEQRLKFHKYVKQFIRGRHVENQQVELRAKTGALVNLRLDTIPYQFEGEERPGFLALLTDNSSLSELEKIKKTIQKDPASLNRTTLMLKDKIRDLNQDGERLASKNRFLHRFSREITRKYKVPIHLVLGYASLLKLDLADTPDEGKLEDVAIIEDHIRFLLEMLDKAAEYADLDSGELQPAPSTQNVREMVDQVFEAVTPKTTATEVSYSAERLILSLDLKVDCDPHFLESILRHLVDNAAVYTQKGRITLTAYEEQQRLWIEVADTGIGIGPTDLPQVFEPFFQVAEGAGNEQRLGLGLTLARKYAELSGFSLEITSKPDTGTKVLVSIGRVYSD